MKSGANILILNRLNKKPATTAVKRETNRTRAKEKKMNWVKNLRQNQPYSNPQVGHKRHQHGRGWARVEREGAVEKN